MKFTVNGIDYSAPLSIGNYRDLMVREDVFSFLKSVLPKDEFEGLSMREVTKVELDLAKELEGVDAASKIKERPTQGWKDYKFPDSLDDTSIRQREDLDLLVRIKSQELADQGLELRDWDTYPIALAIYMRKGGDKYVSDMDTLTERIDEMEDAPVRLAIQWSVFFSTASKDTQLRLLRYFPDLLRSLVLKRRQQQQEKDSQTNGEAKILSLSSPKIVT